MTELQEKTISDIARKLGYADNSTDEDKALASSLLALLGASKIGLSGDLNTVIIQKVNEYLEGINQAKARRN